MALITHIYTLKEFQLCTPRQGNPFKLEIIILDYIFSWGLWLMTEPNSKKKKSVESWSQLFQGTAIYYTLMEK